MLVECSTDSKLKKFVKQSLLFPMLLVQKLKNPIVIGKKSPQSFNKWIPNSSVAYFSIFQSAWMT